MEMEDEEKFAWQVGSGLRSHFMYDSPYRALIAAEGWLQDNPNAQGKVRIWRQTIEVVAVNTINL